VSRILVLCCWQPSPCRHTSTPRGALSPSAFAPCLRPIGLQIVSLYYYILY